MMTTPKRSATATAASAKDKAPRTERGRKTMRKLLDAAAAEFGEKGFHDASITGITARAGAALGTFYTYFDSKDAIFRTLVTDLSNRVRVTVGQEISKADGALGVERTALASFLRFARENKEIYRIIDEAEFVDPAAYRQHYQTTAARIFERLQAGAAAGELRDDLSEAHAWAIMGMNVFLGLRFSIWDEDMTVEDVVAASESLLRRGIAKA